MSDPQAPTRHKQPLGAEAGASELARLIARLGVVGVVVLLASVALAVGGPQLDWIATRVDPRVWAVGSALLGGVALLVVFYALTRQQPAEPAEPVAAEPVIADLALQRAHTQLQALMRAVPHGLALTRERRFEWANASFCEQLGWGHGELLGRSPYELFSSVNADDSLGAALRSAFAAGQPYTGDLQFRRRDGRRFLGRLQARQIDPAEPAAGTLWQLEVLSVQTAEVAAPASGNHDRLTGLLHGPAFEAALAAWLTQAPAGQTASLLHLDLDGFKRFNDSAGREAGDALLCAVAGVLQAHARVGDAVARLEGDTYTMLLPGCVTAVAVQLGQRLRAELAGLRNSQQGPHPRVGATVGVAEINRREAGGASDWLARGQAAWYEAKYGGRGAVRVAAPATSVALVLPA